MFGFDKLTISNQKVQIEELKADVATWKKTAEQYEQRAKELADMINGAVASAPVYFDFKNMKVFSVERNVNNGKPCTIIGYLLQEPVLSSDGEMIVGKDVLKEWYLYCSEDRHAELVEQFKKAIK